MISEFKNTELGDIPIDWDFVEFSSIAELRHGYQFRNYDFTESGIKILKITQIKGNETIDLTSCSFISAERIDDFRRVVIEKGDILIALTGATIGKIARFNSDELVLQNYRVGNFFPIDENTLSKDFLFNYLRSNFFFHQILARQTQSAQQNIGKDEINQMMIFFPSFLEQKAIAKVLTAFDNKIENLQAQNKTLEDTAQAIFKEWFGKFKVGDVLPDGWKVAKLGEIAYNHSKSFKFSKEKVVFINTGDVSNGQFLHTNESSPEGLPGQAKKAIELHDILYSEIRPKNRRFAFVDFETPNYVVSTKFMIIKPLNDFSPFTLYFILKSKDAIDEFNTIAESRSGTFPQITFDSIKNYSFILPPQKTLKRFENILNIIMSKQKNNAQQIQTLKKTRDILLPKLMSGKLRVNEFKN